MRLNHLVADDEPLPDFLFLYHALIEERTVPVRKRVAEFQGFAYALHDFFQERSYDFPKLLYDAAPDLSVVSGEPCSLAFAPQESS